MAPRHEPQHLPQPELSVEVHVGQQQQQQMSCPLRRGDSSTMRCEPWCAASSHSCERWCKCASCPKASCGRPAPWPAPTAPPAHEQPRRSCFDRRALTHGLLEGKWEQREHPPTPAAGRCPGAARGPTFVPRNCSLPAANPWSLSGRVMLVGDSLLQYQFRSLVDWLRRAGRPLECHEAAEAPRPPADPASTAVERAVRSLMWSDAAGGTALNCSGDGLVLLSRRLNLLPPRPSEVSALFDRIFEPLGTEGVAVLNVGAWSGALARQPALAAGPTTRSPAGGAGRRANFSDGGGGGGGGSSRHSHSHIRSSSRSNRNGTSRAGLGGRRLGDTPAAEVVPGGDQERERRRGQKRNDLLQREVRYEPKH